MNKTFLATTAILVALITPALAGTPPVKSKTSSAAAAEACAALGVNGETITFSRNSGCRNTETGAAISCDQDGQCTEYFADPRWKKIKLLQRDGQQQPPARLPLKANGANA